MKLVYQALTEYILSQLPQAYRGHFYAWMDNGKIIDEGRTLTADGQILFYLNYKAELLFNEFPYGKINPLRLMALIKLWLDDYDKERARIDADEIEYDLNLINDDIADLGFTIDITEPVYITETDENPDIDIDGKGYVFAAPTIRYADNIRLQVNDAPADTLTADSKP